MLKEYTEETEDGTLVLNSNFKFTSPSTAAAFCLGRSENGWKSWKDKDNKTLDSVYRKSLE